MSICVGLPTIGVQGQKAGHEAEISAILAIKKSKVMIDSIISYTSKHRKDSAMEILFVEGLQVANKNKYKALEARLLDGYGVFKRDFSDYTAALDLHKKALQIARRINNESIEMYALNNIGVVFRRLDQNTEALNNHMSALKIAEKEKDDYSASVSLNSIGNIHIAIGNYDDAITYFKKCLPIAYKAGNNLGIAMNLNNIGEAYERLYKLDSAKKYYEQSLEYNKKVSSEKGIAICYGSLGSVYQTEGDYKKAQELFESGLEMNKKLGDKIFIAGSYNNLGEVYLLQKEIGKAETMYNDALNIAGNIGSITEMRTAFEGLKKVKEQQGDYKQALEYSDLVKFYTDSINKENNNRHVRQVEAIYQTETEQAKIELLQNTRRNDRVIMIGSLILFALLLITGILYYLRNSLLERNKGLQRELEIRSQIASDLHDDMGSSLSSIHIFSELLRKQDSKSEELLSKIEENAKDTLEALDDIIWLVKPSNDKFSNLSMHISQYAVPLFEGKDIDFEIDFADSISEVPLPMETRRNIFLIIKESVNNLVKYSQCKEALIRAEHDGENIIFTIKDNGKGFDPEMITNRNGLKNLKNRAKQINADLKINSTIGKGTTITLLLNAKELVGVG
ncbi:MAG: tetratricopeptide repeat protein [Niabella sp.]